MLDFIKTLNLSEELNCHQIYELFKSDSSKLNIQLLSELQKIKTNEELINYNSNQNCKTVFNIFKKLSSVSSLICEGKKDKNYKSETKTYISEVSKVIFLFSLIQKNIELLSKMLKDTKKYIKNFCIKGIICPQTKKNINSCIQDLINSSIVISQRNYSRRSTKENTINSKVNITFLRNSPLTFKQPDNSEEKFIFPEIQTPKFEEEEKDEKDNLSFTNIKQAISKRNSIKIFDSSMTLPKMKFDLQPEFKPEPRLEKTKSHGIKSNKDMNKNIKEISLFYEKKKDIMYIFLNIINKLYKVKKINSQEKIELKNLVISDYYSMIKKFHNFYDDNYDINKNIENFLFEQI